MSTISFRNKILSVLDVVLRVPPVFVLDSLLMHGFGGPVTGSKLLRSHLFGHLLHSPPVLSSDGSSFDDQSDTSRDHLDQPVVTPLNSTMSLLDQLFNDPGDGTDPDLVLDSSSTTLNELSSNMVWITCYVYCLGAALIVFTLSTKQLFSLYLWIISLLLIFWSFFANESYINYVTSSITSSSLTYELFTFNSTPLARFTGNYFLQVILCLLFCFLSSPRQSFLSKKLVGAFFIVPTMLSLLPGSYESDVSGKSSERLDSSYMRTRKIVLVMSPLLSTGIALFYIVINVLHETRHVLYRMYRDLEWGRTIVRHYGIYTLIENQWSRLHVPQVLRVFWLTRLVEQALVMIVNSNTSNHDSNPVPITSSSDDQVHSNGDFLLFASNLFSSFPSLIVPSSFDSDSVLDGCKELLVRGCETVIAVLGMTSVISSISHEIGSGIQWFLSSEAPEDRGIGTVSAILFFILALQTGITGMEPEKRFQRLYRNICLLFTAILHFIHNIVSPQLFSLSASRNMSVSKHVRSLIVCLMLIILPTYFMIVLWKGNPISTWLLAVSAFSIEVIIKVLISLLIYILFMLDAYRTTMWEPLDDYVYYIKSFGSTIEFIFGIFLFFNGAWILLFESGGTIRALMMCIHAYFNIWMQAKQGWQKFMRRRLAVHKINSLPEASRRQLEEFDDVCAICYQELQSARITRCNHYFHGVCLRKWLYVQDICPLCHETLTADSDTSQPEAGGRDQRVDHQGRENEPSSHGRSQEGETSNGRRPNGDDSTFTPSGSQGNNDQTFEPRNDTWRRLSGTTQSCPRRDNQHGDEEQLMTNQGTVHESMATRSSSKEEDSPANSFHSTISSSTAFPLVGHSRSLEEDVARRISESSNEESSREGSVSQSNQSTSSTVASSASAFVNRRTSRRLVREQGIDISDTETISTRSNQSSTSSTAQSSASTVRLSHEHNE